MSGCCCNFYHCASHCRSVCRWGGSRRSGTAHVGKVAAPWGAGCIVRRCRCWQHDFNGRQRCGVYSLGAGGSVVALFAHAVALSTAIAAVAAIAVARAAAGAWRAFAALVLAFVPSGGGAGRCCTGFELGAVLWRCGLVDLFSGQRGGAGLVLRAALTAGLTTLTH